MNGIDVAWEGTEQNKSRLASYVNIYIIENL